LKVLKLYLESSVFGAYFDKRQPERFRITRDFFQEIEGSGYTLYISELVIREIEALYDPLKSEMFSLVKEHMPERLELNEEAFALAQHYVDEKIIPEDFMVDAIQVAIAVVHNMDVIVSWNMKHIVNLRTKMGVNGISKSLGYKEIEIDIPEEVVS